MNYRAWFAEWFNKFNPVDNQWLNNMNLHTTVEDSPWHREANVYVHTKMCIDEYFKILGDEEWTHKDVLGAIALAFHDTGKPAAKEIVTKDDGSTYNRFGGHEKDSANSWRDYLTQFSNQFTDIGTIEDIFYPVAWMIEHHLPYAVRDKEKVNNIAVTVDRLRIRDTFFNVLRADARGRISDDHATKLQKVEEWISNFPVREERTRKLSNRKLTLLIGASGSGKSTYYNDHVPGLDEGTVVYSYDHLRLEWYTDPHVIMNPVEQYQHCFQMSINDKEFNNRAMIEFFSLIKDSNIKHIFVDNMNMSAKSRRAFIASARQHGLLINAVIFVVAKETINKRQVTRRDKFLSEAIIDSQYKSMSVPSYNEVDVIEIVVN